MNRPRRDERGSGTVYALGVIAVLLAAALGIAGLIQAQSATGRARAAADLAAISGATVLSSVIAPSDPCAMAQRVAAANGASVSEGQQLRQNRGVGRLSALVSTPAHGLLGSV